MIYKTKLKPLLQYYIFLLGSGLIVTAATFPRLHVEMESVCVDGASIMVSLHSLTPRLMTCVIRYKEVDGTVINRTDPIYITDNNVTLHGLKIATKYLVHVICDDNDSSLLKNVTTGVCQSHQVYDSSSGQKTTPRSDEPDVTYKEQAIFSASAVDIVLGLMFSVAAIITVTMTAYYMYRKYQRRRRLQQFLTTPHTDPFESLQSYMEEES